MTSKGYSEVHYIWYTSGMNKIIFLPDYSEGLRSELSSSIEQWNKELMVLLPNLPDDIIIEFDNNQLIQGYGTGGTAWDLRTLKLGYDPNFGANPEDLIKELRAIYFHEIYHLVRKFSFITTPNDLPALTNAIEEGVATKFEMVHGGGMPSYGKCEERNTMLDWLEEVKALPDGFDYDWEHWKFFDPETGRQWILYKVGVFIVDELLKNNPKLSIKSVVFLDAEKIFKFSKL